jgi:PhnB protein
VAGDTLLYRSDVPGAFGKPVETGNKFQINIETESSEEVKRLLNALSDGGKAKMPLQVTEWAENFGMCIDQFEV